MVAIGGAVWVASCVSGCVQSPSQTYARMEKVARAVPVPEGLRLSSVSHAQMDPGLGVTDEVNAVYSNPTMTCAELKSAWLVSLKQAHRDATAESSGQIVLTDTDFTVVINLYGESTTLCAEPLVAVETR